MGENERRGERKRKQASERRKAGERQVESIVAVATCTIYGKWRYHIAKVRLCREREIVQY